PSMEAKTVHSVLDSVPLIDAALMQIAEWIASYYLAPIGEVLRSMLPLQAEVRRDWSYRISEVGQKALYDSAVSGNSARSKKPVEEQMLEYRVLDFLSQVDEAREHGLRHATGATRDLLRALQQKRWIVREDISSARNAERTEKIAHLVRSETGNEEIAGRKLNDNQQKLLSLLESAGSSMSVESLREHLNSRS